MIKNIKASIVVKCDKNWENVFKNILQINSTFKKSGNIFTVKNSSFTLFIVEKKINSEGTLIHVNLTGVKNFSHLDTVVRFFKTRIFPDTWSIISLKIDSVLATFTFFKKINLRFLFENIKGAKYNREKFTGLVLKTPNYTAILFSTGKINIFGCKTNEQILEAWREVQMTIKSASTNIQVK